jgi:hypothetical protein
MRGPSAPRRSQGPQTHAELWGLRQHLPLMIRVALALGLLPDLDCTRLKSVFSLNAQRGGNRARHRAPAARGKGIPLRYASNAQ